MFSLNLLTLFPNGNVEPRKEEKDQGKGYSGEIEYFFWASFGVKPGLSGTKAGAYGGLSRLKGNDNR